MPGLASFQKGQKFTIYRLIYVINELVSGKKFTNARSLLSTGLLSPGSTVPAKRVLSNTYFKLWFIMNLLLIFQKTLAYVNTGPRKYLLSYA